MSVTLPERGVSMTLAGRFNDCPHSAFLYLKHGGGARSHAMLGGSAGHRIIELAVEAMIEQGENYIPPEVVKAICNEVFADPRYGCPIEMHDLIREAAYRWASRFALDPATVIACERLFELDVAGIPLRAKIDLALLEDNGSRVVVRDWKFARAMPATDDIGRKRPDGTIAAKAFQLVTYALVVAFGVPVRVEGEGDDRVETREPFGLAPRAQELDVAYVFPAIEDREGEMGKRGATLTRLELEEYRASLEALFLRMQADEPKEWPAVPDPEGHCKTCVAQPECPIPVVLRTHAGEINTVEQAAEAALRAEWDRAQLRARDREIKAFVKAQPEQRLRFGPHFVMEPGYSAAERIKDKDGMWSAIDRAVSYGEPFDPRDHVQTVESTPLKVRKLSEAELAEEAEMESNGMQESEPREAVDDLDARFGAEAPW